MCHRGNLKCICTVKCCVGKVRLERYVYRPHYIFIGVDVQDKCIYLNGCSLGLLPIQTTELIDGELKKWQTRYIGSTISQRMFFYYQAHVHFF